MKMTIKKKKKKKKKKKNLTRVINERLEENVGIEFFPITL